MRNSHVHGLLAVTAMGAMFGAQSGPEFSEYEPTLPPTSTDRKKRILAEAQARRDRKAVKLRALSQK
jgi:hypothetical protein